MSGSSHKYVISMQEDIQWVRHKGKSILLTAFHGDVKDVKRTLQEQKALVDKETRNASATI